jgi:uncharacterized protein
MNVLVAFVLPAVSMGLLGSVHCTTMCGGIASIGSRGPRYALYLHLGRLITYAALGALAGALGSHLTTVASLTTFRIVVRGFTFLVLASLGLQFIGFSRTFSVSTLVERLGRPVWRLLGPFARRLTPTSAAEALLVGVFWGWIPCGLLYSATILAMAADGAITGAVTMLAFGASTLPALSLVTLVSKSIRKHPGLHRAAGVALVGLGAIHGSLAITEGRALVQGRAASCCPHPSAAHEDWRTSDE